MSQHSSGVEVSGEGQGDSLSSQILSSDAAERKPWLILSSPWGKKNSKCPCSGRTGEEKEVSASTNEKSVEDWTRSQIRWGEG